MFGLLTIVYFFIPGLGALICCLGIIIFFYGLKKRKLIGEFGYKFPKDFNLKELLFLIPLLLVPFTGLLFGYKNNENIYSVINYAFYMFYVAFFEEFIFRSVIVNELYRNHNKYFTVIVSALLFGFAHLMNYMSGLDLYSVFLQIFRATMVGFMLGAFYLKTFYILPCIFCHFFINLFALFDTGNVFKENIIIAIISLLYGIYLIKRVPLKKKYWI